MDVSVSGCVSLRVSPVIDWWPVGLSPHGSWDPVSLNLITKKMNKRFLVYIDKYLGTENANVFYNCTEYFQFIFKTVKVNALT